MWLVVLLLLGCLVYLNQVGLPDFLKQPLLQELRDRGVDLQFARLRLRWYEGIVAENIRFGTSEEPNSPLFTAREARVGLELGALARLQLRVGELVIQQGRLAWQIAQPPPARELSVNNIQAHLRFLPGDRWSLENLTADFASARLRLSGTVTNASAVAQWQLFRATAAGPTPADAWQKRLTLLADTLERLQFSATPELRLNVEGNGESLSSFAVRMVVAVPDAGTPWGSFTGSRFSLSLSAADTNGTSRAEVNLEAATAQTPWASVTNFQMAVYLDAVEARTNLVQAEMKLAAEHAQTKWASGSNVVFSAEWVHSVTNPVPVAGEGRLMCAGAESKWASGRGLELSGRLSLPEPGSLPVGDESWAWWTNIQPFCLEWRCDLKELNASGLGAGEIVCAGSWRAPRLTVKSLAATLYEGQLDARAELDVATRRLEASISSDVDPRWIAPALSDTARGVLDEFTWNSAPRVEGSIALNLPAWTNRQPDWVAEVRPTLDLHGAFNLEAGGSYRGVEVSSLRSQFAYSNMIWDLPSLTLVRPEGQLTAEHRFDDRTKDFYWHVTSTVDPGAIRPLLDPEAQKAFGLLVLTVPPFLEAEVRGRSQAPEVTSIQGRVSLTNFTFRGESFTGLRTSVLYSNRVVQFLEPRVQLGEERVRADGLTADFNTQYVYLTNGFSTADPMVIARAIGPHIAAAIEPYVFSNPPTAYVAGTIPMYGEEGADLSFQLEGGAFHWWRFNVPWISGRLHWRGLSLTMRDVRAKFYRGDAGGLADFSFPRGKGCDFTCSLEVTNSLLQELMADVSTTTNRLEGTLNGTLNFTRVNTTNWNTLFGYGELRLRDGFIWDLPLFGIFTPVLDGISPGLGHVRASSGSCSYYITNGVIRTDDLEIRSPTLRLQYRGTVDLESRVNARVEAEFLRDMWLVGPIVSTVLWPVTKMFEYRVTGTLDEPKTEPVYIVPKLMLIPLHPFRSLKSLLPESPASRTNAPPPFKDN